MPDPVGTPTVTELLVETRTMVAFQGRSENLDSQLPDGWSASAWPSGASAGANLLAVFSERLLGLDGQAVPLPQQETLQLAVVAVRAAHSDGRAGLQIMFGLAGSPLGAPGPYGVFLEAEARITRLVRSTPEGIRRGVEDWSFSGDDGNRLALQVEYERGTPTRDNPQTPAPLTVYSVTHPDFFRFYENLDQGSDLLMSAPLGRDATSYCHFDARGPRLEALFAEAERVSITSLPWMMRRVSVP